MTDPLLTERFDRALGVAARLHRDQVRKGTTVPYMSHLIGACSIALEFGAQLWYYRSLVIAFRSNPEHEPALIDALDRTVTEMEALGGLAR